MKAQTTRTVLITGGSSGIGLATAQKYSEHQDHVILVGKNEEKLRQAAQSLGNNSSYFAADVTNTESLKALLHHLTDRGVQLDVLITSAGLGKFGGLEEVTEYDYDLVMDTNTKGTFFTVSTLKSLIKENGHIVLLSSFIAGKSLPLTSVLSASKAAVESFTKIFARELSKDQIHVNCISPGSIKTNFMSFASPSEKQQETLSANMPHIPLGKRGEATQVAEAIFFITGEQANYINGAILSVDGGISVA